VRSSVDPILDPLTRTARVRALVSTPEASLRPETFVNVRIRVPLGRHLAVPKDAVLDTGEHQIVFVVRGEGQFDARRVEPRPRGGGLRTRSSPASSRGARW
jgi:multidrug efflux pump subunit AcrA (membrane-fusion protein)